MGCGGSLSPDLRLLFNGRRLEASGSRCKKTDSNEISKMLAFVERKTLQNSTCVSGMTRDELENIFLSAGVRCLPTASTEVRDRFVINAQHEHHRPLVRIQSGLIERPVVEER